VVLDTVRADHTGAYGYERNTTPSLDGLAEISTVFTRSMSSSPWTLPSHASLFTGLDPFEHGAHSFYSTADGTNVHPLPSDHLTLAEALAERGFATGAFVANTAFLASRFQIDQGFETYEAKREPARLKNRRILEWIDEQASRPFFLFVNYLDSHRPYNTQPRPGLIDPPAERNPQLLNQLRARVMGGVEVNEPNLRQRVIDQYDTGIAHADEGLGELLSHLQAEGLLSASLVLVTSDHGEYFGEHDLVEHSKDIYQEAIRVPLVVKAPGQLDARRDDTPISSADIPYLIASSLEPALRDEMRTLFPRAPGSQPVIVENHYSRTADLQSPIWGARFHRVRRALLDWPYKVILSSDGENEVYDLEADPGESRNLIDVRPELAQRLRRQLEERVVEPDPERVRSAPELSDAERKDLRALGYIE
jgi:arylsulfatase A-like enzyme